MSDAEVIPFIDQPTRQLFADCRSFADSNCDFREQRFPMFGDVYRLMDNKKVFIEASFDAARKQPGRFGDQAYRFQISYDYEYTMIPSKMRAAAEALRRKLPVYDNVGSVAVGCSAVHMFDTDGLLETKLWRSYQLKDNKPIIEPLDYLAAYEPRAETIARCGQILQMVSNRQYVEIDGVEQRLPVEVQQAISAVR